MTEMGAHKSFSIVVNIEALNWLRSTFKCLITTPSTNYFFLEKRFENHHIWVRNLKNKCGNMAEVFKVDYKSRKSCIMIP